MGDYTVGQKIGDYEILGVLGAGGMGKVYQVRNTISERVEAMKILLPNLADEKELAERFLREIKLLAGLNHPNIAELRTALTLDNQLVMIMEYVDGATLASRLQQGSMPVAEAVNCIDQVLAALAYAHQMNIVHRDIKPANMMVTRDGVVKLMDFGIARSENDSGMTVTGTTLGSLNYMSPEQVRGETADARSDLYSVGLSLYEILTGRLPFRGDSRYSLMVAQLQQAPEPPIVLRPDLPEALNDIILMVLSKDPERRFQSATAFRNGLKSAVPEAALAAGAGEPAVYSANTIVDHPAATNTPTAVRPTPAVLRPPTRPVTAVETPAAAPAKIEVPPPGSHRTHRGMYVALGGVLVVVMLAAAAVYVPRRAKTRAADGAIKTAQPALEVAPATQPQAPAAAPVDQPAAAPAAAAPALPTTAPSADNAQTQAAHVSHAGARKSSQSGAQTAAAAAVTQAEAAQAAQDAADAQAKADELDEASKQADQLGSRAAAIESSLTTLQREQATQGYGLRGDMVAARQRMEANLAQAQSALQQQDAARAKRYLDLAEDDAEKLERFLGQ